jgi:hypothetical protein
MDTIDEKFVGVFSSDQLPQVKLKTGESVIINLSDSEEVGTHFVAAFKKAQHIIYFDSLALNVVTDDIEDFLNLHRKIIYLRRRLQPLSSIYCGYYCIAFIIKMKSNTLMQFHRLFQKTWNLSKNDKIILDIVLTCIK